MADLDITALDTWMLREPVSAVVIACCG